MDVMLQRHCAKYIYVVPEGLREIMSDISREVLRTQPTHIYTFIADYLDALLITRENARVAAKFVESITEMGITISDLLTRTGMTREDADNTASVIQRAFRKHLAEKMAAKLPEQVEEANIITEIIYEAGISPEQAETAAVIIQNAYRNYKQRQERESLLFKGMIDWRVAARTSLRLYRKTGVTYEEANRAATLIKAAYKGYYTRRMMKRLLKQSLEEEEEEEEEEVSSESSSAEDLRGPGSAEKAVRIDYGTVIPHVDFDEPQYITEQEEEEEGDEDWDSERVAREIMKRVLQSAIPDSHTKLDVVIEVPEPDGEKDATDLAHIEQEGEGSIYDPDQTPAVPENTAAELAETAESEAPTESPEGASEGVLEEGVPEEAFPEDAPEAVSEVAEPTE